MHILILESEFFLILFSPNLEHAFAFETFLYPVVFDIPIIL